MIYLAVVSEWERRNNITSFDASRANSVFGSLEASDPYTIISDYSSPSFAGSGEMLGLPDDQIHSPLSQSSSSCYLAG